MEQKKLLDEGAIVPRFTWADVGDDVEDLGDPNDQIINCFIALSFMCFSPARFTSVGTDVVE